MSSYGVNSVWMPRPYMHGLSLLSESLTPLINTHRTTVLSASGFSSSLFFPSTDCTFSAFPMLPSGSLPYPLLTQPRCSLPLHSCCSEGHSTLEREEMPPEAIPPAAQLVRAKGTPVHAHVTTACFCQPAGLCQSCIWTHSRLCVT